MWGIISERPQLFRDNAVLQRNVTTAEQTLAAIQQNYDQVRLAEMSALPDLKILDRAVVPMRPVGSLAPVVIVLAFLGSLGAGVVGAVLLDRTDPRFRYPEQVTTDMGLNILGVVPRVSRENGNGRNAPQVIEALRSIRLGSDRGPFERLSDRELEVLQLLSQDASNQQIADKLTISLSTVKTHVHHVLDKLGTKNRTLACTGSSRSSRKPKRYPIS